MGTRVPLDIYKKRPITTDSQEHIIPNFLGGCLQPSGLIDKTTNDEFGSSIDAALNRALLPFRVFLDARSHRKPNEPAPTIGKVKGADGVEYRVEAGGYAKVRRPRVEIHEDDNLITIRGTISDEGELRQALWKLARRKGLNLDTLVERLMTDAEHRSEAPPILDFPLPLLDKDPYRAIAKIACNLLALHDRELFLTSAFDPIRAFVLEGTSPTPHPVQATDVDLRRAGMGPLDHYASVQSSEDGHVRGLVVLFGTLAFAIHLGTTSAPATPFRRTYRVDQLGRADRLDDDFDHKVVGEPFEVCCARSYEEYRSLCEKQLRLLAKDVELRRLVADAYTPHWDQWLKRFGQGNEPTEEDQRELAAAIGNAVTQALMPRILEAARRRHDEASEAVEEPEEEER